MKKLSPPDFETQPLLLVDCEARTLAALEKSLPRMGGRWLTLGNDAALPTETPCAALVELEYFASPQALTQLNERGVPVIALTSHEALSQIQRALDLGATALLPKPINQRAIYTTLMMAVGLRQQLSEQSDALVQLRERVAQIPLVSQAVAMLMVEHQLNEQDAWVLLRSEAMRNNLRIEQAAEKWLARRQRQQQGGRP
ncbi:ANTAR domain-containing protein [Affinibrenneria salicis]|uniref:ANTAR domain-containing protein n=1 Tax=Affinibrenneria salicis TaxID=2590031 RepID=A0A5J5FZB2_9GAMM|nr:ANTAR domain-containing protein [Affinibrenneria salicis]KAA8999375.1 ANTAR domain-containing protein [Affinibrenneria salicis]